MIFVDSNIPMYLVGTPHPNRELLEAFLRRRTGEHYVTSAEVYQEILHRYVAINRRGAIEDAFGVLDALVVSVFPISRDEVEVARQAVERQPELSARDCLHLAVMQAHGIHQALTFDRGFAAGADITVLP